MAKEKVEANVNNVNGLHVRPSTAIAQAALKYQCNVFAYKQGSADPINLKSSLDIISAFIVYNDKLILECDGKDASNAIVEMKKVVETIYDYEDAHPVNK